MAGSLGVDIAALDDLPDPEQTVAEGLNVAYALARRLLTASGAHEEIGDPRPYDSINLRDYVGKRMSQAEVDLLQAQVNQILAQDQRVSTVTATVTVAAGVLLVRVRGEGTEGPFDFILSIGALTVELLFPET